MKVNPVVFFVSAGVVLAFLLLGAAFPRAMGSVFGALQDGIVANFGWFYILAVAFFLGFVLWLLVSPYGAVRLGGDDEEPDYSYPTWFAMLFSAGMGIGLLFYGVAEPILHFGAPLEAEPGTVAAAREAMHLAFFHWGLHAWAIYIVVGLSLAYFAYRHDLPLTIRSTFHPLLGDRIHGPIGNLVEIMAVFGTLFGIATSLGLGVMQINSGLDYLGVLGVSTGAQLWLIAGITLVATVSVVTGLDVGIRRLSELNLLLGLALLLFVFALGPTVFILSSLVQNVGYYVQHLLEVTFRTTAYRGIDWQKGWTMFYWGWWISWAPFVGMFIARISRGRTIREFIGGVLFVPALLTFVWFSVFGGTAIHLELEGGHAVSAAVKESVPTALFVLLDTFPWSALSSAIAVIVVATFFVTSADSGALVIDTLTSGGETESPVWQRIFWAVAAGAAAGVLLLFGGLQALQTAAITTALPFCAIMLVMAYSLWRGLRDERAAAAPHAASAGEAVQPPAPAQGPRPWAARLRTLAERKGRPRRAAAGAPPGSAAGLIEGVALPAFAEIAEELRGAGREARIERGPALAAITVLRAGREEFYYAVRLRAFQRMAFAFPEPPRGAAALELRAEIVLRSGPRAEFDAARLTREGLVRNFLDEYASWTG